MKRLIWILFSFISIAATAQNYPDFGLDKVHIADSDRTIVAEIDPVNHPPAAKSSLFYYWYSANLIHATQGGYSGALLNGPYNEYFLNKNLKEQGTFKKGLRNGAWKSWNTDGTINHSEMWENGVNVTGRQSFIRRKLKFLKRKHGPADTSKKH